MKLEYLIECDGMYINYDKYKNMHHKFKKVENIGQATLFINEYEANQCIRDMLEYFEFKNATVIHFKRISITTKL